MEHLQSCGSLRTSPAECDCTARYLADVRSDARRLAETLRTVADAGVPHSLVLPQLVLVFREAFGEMPANIAGLVPGLAS